jgi:hypothetical protein
MSTSISFTKFDSTSSVDLLTGDIKTSKIQGAESSPALIVQSLKLTNEDGEKVISSSYDKRQITLEGTIKCDTPALLRSTLEDAKAIISGKGYLDIGFEGDTVKRYTVEVINWVITSAAYNINWVPFSINFSAFDSPFAESVDETVLYSANAITSDVALISDLDGSANPSVSAEIALPTIGGLTGIEFRNLNTNTAALLQPTFETNDVVSINTGAKTCLLNGVNVDFSGQVPTFLPGSNDWRLSFLTSSVTIDVQQTFYNTERFIFGDIWIAQSFQASTDIKTHRIDLMLARLGNPTSVQVDIYTNSSSHPGSAITGATASLNGTSISLIPGYISFYLQNATSLTAATTYWIVVQVTGATSDINNGFYIKAANNNSYANYTMSRSSNAGSSWGDVTGKDVVFRVWKTPVLVSNSDTTEENYTELFINTTHKDAINTTANWDTSGTKLILGTTSPLDTGFVSPSAYPGTYLTYNGWSNPDNIYSADGNYATQVVGATIDPNSDYQTYQNFGFGITSGSVVTGFDIKLKGKVDSGTATFNVYLVYDSNNDGLLNVVDLSNAFSRGATSFTLTTTNTEYTSVTASISALGANFANGLCTLWVAPVTGSKTYSIDRIQVKLYYATYDISKNLGQSSTLNSANAAQLASARLVSTESKPVGTDISYSLEGDATGGFQAANNNATNIMAVSALGTTPTHKWKATLTGSSGLSPYIDSLNIYYKAAMPVGATTDRIAQSFSSGAGGSISGLLLNLVKTTVDVINYTVEIQADSAGSPSGSAISNGTATILAASVSSEDSGNTFSWITTTFSVSPSLSASTTYWIVIKVGTAGNGKLLWRARGGDSYSNGTAKYSTNSGSAWTTMTNQDFLFQILSSGSTFEADIDISYKPRNI